MAQTISLHDPVFSTEIFPPKQNYGGGNWTIDLNVFTERSGEPRTGETHSSVSLSIISFQVKDPERFLKTLNYQVQNALKKLPDSNPLLEENKT